MLLLIACTAPRSPGIETPPPFDLEVGTTPTVYQARISAPDVDAVRFSWADGDTIDAVADEDGTWTATLFMPAGQNVEVWAEVTTGEDTTATDPIEVEVEGPPAGLPAITATVPADGDDLYLLTWPTTSPGLVSIVDRAGRTRWWHEAESAVIYTEARPSAIGHRIVMLEQTDRPGLRLVSPATGETSFISVADAHHDFCELPDGTFLVLTSDERVQDGVTVTGDAVVRVDPSAGTVSPLWSVWSTLNFDFDALPIGTTTVDWTHANSVTYDDVTERVLVSLHNLDTVLELDPTTGDTTWRMGGDRETLALTGGNGFYGQHGAIRTDAGVMLFNNRDTLEGTTDLWSEAVEYELDFATRTYRRTWSYDAGQMVFSPVLGNAEPLDDGGVLIGWGSAGRISEVTREGEVRWQLDTELGGALGYIRRIESILGD